MKKLICIFAIMLAGVAAEVSAQVRAAASLSIGATVQPLIQLPVVDRTGHAYTRAGRYEATVSVPIVVTKEHPTLPFTAKCRATLPSSGYQLLAKLDGEAVEVSINGVPVPRGKEVVVGDRLPLDTPVVYSIDAELIEAKDTASISIVLIARPE